MRGFGALFFLSLLSLGMVVPALISEAEYGYPLLLLKGPLPAIIVPCAARFTNFQE